MLTDRSVVMFMTQPLADGDVYDETFHDHARAILELVRKAVDAEGWSTDPVDYHDHYGMAFSARRRDSRDVYLLLQAADEWLLMLTTEWGFIQKWKGADETHVDEELANAVNRALLAQGVTAIKWCTRPEFDKGEH